MIEIMIIKSVCVNARALHDRGTQTAHRGGEKTGSSHRSALLNTDAPKGHHNIAQGIALSYLCIALGYLCIALGFRASTRRRMKNRRPRAPRPRCRLARHRLHRHGVLVKESRREVSPVIRSLGTWRRAWARIRDRLGTARPRAGPPERRAWPVVVHQIVGIHRGRVAHDQTIKLIPIERPSRLRRDKMIAFGGVPSGRRRERAPAATEPLLPTSP